MAYRQTLYTLFQALTQHLDRLLTPFCFLLCAENSYFGRYGCPGMPGRTNSCAQLFFGKNCLNAKKCFVGG